MEYKSRKDGIYFLQLEDLLTSLETFSWMANATPGIWIARFPTEPSYLAAARLKTTLSQALCFCSQARALYWFLKLYCRQCNTGNLWILLQDANRGPQKQSVQKMGQGRCLNERKAFSLFLELTLRWELKWRQIKGHKDQANSDNTRPEINTKSVR